MIERLAESSQLQEDIRLLGGIPILLNILTKQTLTNTLSLEAREKVLALKAACCSTITQLVLNDSNAQLIVQVNMCNVFTCSSHGYWEGGGDTDRERLLYCPLSIAIQTLVPI